MTVQGGCGGGSVVTHGPLNKTEGLRVKFKGAGLLLVHQGPQAG